MKTNAVIRIVLWSIVIIVLVGILLWSTGITRFLTRDEEPAATAAPMPVITQTPGPTITESINPFPAAPEDTYVVLETMNVRSAPSLTSKAVAVLEEGTEVTPALMEEIAGKRWGYITEPEQGWIVMDLLQNQSSPAEEIPVMEAPEAEGPGTGYGRNPEGLREINIEWAVGNIYIQSADVERVQVREINRNEDKVDNMVVNSLERDKLIIRYSDRNSWNLGINITNDMAKDLYITVPQGFYLESLEVNAASATLTVQDMTIREMDFDGASGTCDFVNCDIGELELSTASGDVSFQGTLNSLDCEAVSASVRAVFDNVPGRIEMESVSGDLDITLPEDASFTVTMDTMRSDFVSDFGYSQKGKNTYYRGTGGCKISMDAMSGDVYVRKATQQPALPEATVPEASVPETTVSSVPETTAVTTAPTVSVWICPEHGESCNDPNHH